MIFVVAFIKPSVESDEMGAFDVPMGLLHLQLKVHGIGEPLVHQRIKLRTALFGEVIFGLVHLGCCYRISG
jgi:hypothetical protein